MIMKSDINNGMRGKTSFVLICCKRNGQYRLVLLGDNKPCKIEGIGSIRFKFHDGAERILTEVRYVPEMKRNLISLDEFDKKKRVCV